MWLTLIFLAVCFLAYSNGANDNFKGVASLFGSRTCGYRLVPHCSPGSSTWLCRTSCNFDS